MTRSMALRALTFFIISSVVFASVGLASYVPAAEVLFAISGALCALMLVFAVGMPAQAPVPVRVRRRRH
jgi:hypothetical protein